MKLLKKVTAFGLAAAMTITGSGFTALAGYSNADGIWDKPITQKIFDSTKGSLKVTNLQVPTLAYDDTSVGLVWEKPEQYAQVADYWVYINGVKQADTARQNFDKNADWTSAYMKAFYDYYNGDGTNKGKSDVPMVKVDIHSYRATGLQPDTEYTFKVVAVDKDNKELGSSDDLKQRTAVAPEIFNIKDFGAQETEKYTKADDKSNAAVEKNTKAIQAAINACTPGGKVVIPEGTFATGSVWLKSNMTFEINGTLWASPNSSHFEVGFLMYPFYTDTRSWGVVNAISSDPTQQLENIRITGNGEVNGNGWKFGEGSTIKGDGYSKFTYKLDGDVDTSIPGNEKYALPRFVGGGNTRVFNQGILASDAAIKYLANLTQEDGSRKYSDELLATLPDIADVKSTLSKLYPDSYDQDVKDAYATRSSLVIMRNIKNVYVDDITVTNPANHSINILDSDNIAVNNVKVLSYDNNNGDGIGVGCSKNVIIWNNFLDTGDDSIGFGSSVGKGAQDAGIQTNSSIWVFGNYLHEGHGGAIAAGSHTGNGIEDILCEDNVMNHTDMPFRFKSAPTNGGYINNITIRDCAVADSDQVFVLTTSYSDPNSASSTEAADVPGTFYNFSVYNVTSYQSKNNTICVYADVDPVKNPEKPWHTHHNLYFQDVTFGGVGGAGGFKNYNGWETLTGAEKAVFYDVKTVSYNSKAKSAKTDAAWTNIKYSKDIQFLGTTMDTLNASTENMKAASVVPVWGTAKATAVSADDGKSVVLNWDKATVDSGSVTYGVDTYIGDQKVDTVDGLKENTAAVSGLSAGVNYSFKVYASENSSSTNNGAKAVAVVNKTEGPSVSLTTTGTLDKTQIAAPSSSDVALTNPIYTCAQATWQSALANDSRVRGYKVYVNGKLNETIYNWQLAKDSQTKTISQQAGRLTPGIENAIKVVAFTDSGMEYEYNTAKVKTLQNYDYQAPVFPSNAALKTEKKDNGDVVLSWDAAKDDTAVGGYRVYVDGEEVHAKDTDVFTPVNGVYTTADTTYTVKGLDLTKKHEFNVQAGDSWWKAETEMGTYDKMAGFNWTVKGLSSSYVPDTVEITANKDEKITAERVKNTIAELEKNQSLVINVTEGSLEEISKDVFNAAAAKGAKILIKSGDVVWEFDQAGDAAASLKSPVVKVNKDIPEVTKKLTSVKDVDLNKILQFSFVHEGVLPKKAKVTIQTGDKLKAGENAILYYFNNKTGLFEKQDTYQVGSDNTVQLALDHCSDYILSAAELPQVLITGENNQTPGNGETPGNNQQPGDGQTPGNNQQPGNNQAPGNGQPSDSNAQNPAPSDGAKTADKVAENESKKSVKTGDTTSRAPIAAAFLVSAAGLGVLFFRRKKSKI